MPNDSLTRAIETVDLPGLVGELYPQSGAKPRTEAVCFASWRDNENTPAFSLFRRENVWYWKDWATGDHGNAFHFLTTVHGMGKQDAAHMLMKRVGISPTALRDGRGGSHSKARVAESLPVSREVAERHLRAPPVAIRALANRGFNKQAIAMYGILRDGDDALIPITSPEGVVLAVKRRKGKLRGPNDPKYVYETEGHGSPAWCSPGFLDCNVVVVVEGELNAMIGHFSMQEAGYNYGFMGAAGAANHLNVNALRDRTVYIYADDDEPGAKAQARWAEDAYAAGAMAVKLMPRDKNDFCEVAAELGRDGLVNQIKTLGDEANTVYTPMDRLVAGYRIRDFVDSAERFVSGNVAHSTGFPAIDSYTGGLPESGVIGIGALASMGKSSLLRRMLLEEVVAGGKVKLYSPDQSAPSIFRLLASSLSGVPATQVRERNFSQDVVDRFREEGASTKDAMEAALKAWKDAYSWIILNLSKRFLVSDEAKLAVIEEDAERALDQGVTMFGGDYLQMFEPEKYSGEKVEGKAADDFKRLARKWKVPMLFAVQLAKSKFGPERKSGIPTSNDILGASAIYNNCEQVYLIYNDYIYARKYATDKAKLLEEASDVAHIIVAKNKEGPSDDDFRVYWEGRLTLFLDPAETLEQFTDRIRKK